MQSYIGQAAHRGGYYFACHTTPTKKGKAYEYSIKSKRYRARYGRFTSDYLELGKP